jgi:hypothetical protein
MSGDVTVTNTLYLLACDECRSVNTITTLGCNAATVGAGAVYVLYRRSSYKELLRSGELYVPGRAMVDSIVRRMLM